MINEILDERGKRYGKFVDVAKATNDIQEAVFDNMRIDKLKLLKHDQSLAIEMICHKLARIAVGDADYLDNWIDIAGYAQLVADRLQGNER